MSARDQLAALANGNANGATATQLPAPAPAPDRNAELAKLIEQVDALREQIAKENTSKPFVPTASPSGATKFVQVKQGDTLASIAKTLGLANAYHELYQPNIGALGSYTDGTLTPDIWLEYRDPVAAKTDRAAAGTWF